MNNFYRFDKKKYLLFLLCYITINKTIIYLYISISVNIYPFGKQLKMKIYFFKLSQNSIIIEYFPRIKKNDGDKINIKFFF